MTLPFLSFEGTRLILAGEPSVTVGSSTSASASSSSENSSGTPAGKPVQLRATTTIDPRNLQVGSCLASSTMRGGGGGLATRSKAGVSARE